MILYTGIKEMQKHDGALEKRLTHMPFTHALTGSNPVRVTNMTAKKVLRAFFFYT